VIAGPASLKRERRSQPYRIPLLVVALFAAATTATMLLAQFDVFGGSAGVAATQGRRLAPFRSVELAGSNNVTIRVGTTQSVVVHADRNLLRRVTTVVQADNLVIGNTPGSFKSKSLMSVEITMPVLSSVTLSGSGNLSVTGIKTSTIALSLQGSGLLRATGRATRLIVMLGGSGAGQLGYLVARDVRAVVSGSGLLAVTATNSLDASVPGDGVIMYYGHPVHVMTSVTGSGTILHGSA
jgi:hypothetical protein